MVTVYTYKVTYMVQLFAETDEGAEARIQNGEGYVSDKSYVLLAKTPIADQESFSEGEKMEWTRAQGGKSDSNDTP